MSQWRLDSPMGRSALIAPERARRPIPTEVGGVDDPFLEGNEHQTPPEVFAIRDADTEPDRRGWRVRVVPNRFPAVRLGDAAPVDDSDSDEWLSGIGAHEVIIECPHSETNLGRLPETSVLDVLVAYRERLRSHRADPRLKHALIFKNQGERAGATISHSHSQLIATPCVLPDVARRLEVSRNYFREHGRSRDDDTIRHEQECRRRVVAETEDFLVWCPGVSRFSYETRILPRLAGSRFEEVVDRKLESLARTLKQTLCRLDAALGDPDLNFVLHTAPFADPETPGDRWWFEIFPRLGGIGGFEWGSGCSITTTYPEDAARVLREVAVDPC